MPQSSPLSMQSTSRSHRTLGFSVVQQIYEVLRHRIIHFELSPGANIVKRDILEEFEVSPTPVREALLRLSEEGLVNIFPQSRTTVSLIDVQHAWEVHFLRLSVDIEVARTLASDIDADGISKLAAWIERQNTELNINNQKAFHAADHGFHQEMYSLAGVPGLAHLIDTRRGHYDRIRGLFHREEERRKVVGEEHRAIVTALNERNAVAAEAAVRIHLGKSLAIIDEIREQNPRYFL